MKKFCMICLLLLVSLQFGCTRDIDRTEAAKETRITDNQLEEKVMARINSNPDLKADHISVDADAEHNRVTLSGTVGSEALRMQAVQIAKGSHPGLVVDDKITVKEHELLRSEYTEKHALAERERAKEHNEKIGTTLDDAWLHAKVVAKLVADTDVAERKINVDVDNGVVTLRGTVDSAAEKTEAERLAKETDGVKRVANQLKIAKAKAS